MFADTSQCEGPLLMKFTVTCTPQKELVPEQFCLSFNSSRFPSVGTVVGRKQQQSWLAIHGFSWQKGLCVLTLLSAPPCLLEEGLTCIDLHTPSLMLIVDTDCVALIKGLTFTKELAV